MSRKMILSLFLLAILAVFRPERVSANALPYQWEGAQGSEILVMEDCPIQVNCPDKALVFQKIFPFRKEEIKKRQDILGEKPGCQGGISMDMKERMHTGDLYLPVDEEILKEQAKCLEKLYDFNSTRPSEAGKRQALLKEMFAEIGEGCYIEPPFHANFGGSHVHFGNHIYANFNLTMVDDTHIYVGDCTMFGPNVVVASAGHPILPELREQAYQYNMPVHIGRNCWIGAGVLIVPGVTIGDNTVIGAGSVVTKDIPANVVAVGNPCRVLREINDHDREFYFKDRKIDWDLLEKKD